MAMWELAPGSPWNAIFSFLLMVLAIVFLGPPCSSRSGFGQYAAGGFEVGGGIDPARGGVDDGDVDPHPRFQRAELLQLLLQFQRRGRQLDEPLQRRTAVGVEADMVVARSLAMGGGGAGEIERAHPPSAERGADRLH